MTTAIETPFLRIVREFDVAPELVFDTFTKPELMRVWWTDQTSFNIDLQVGGHWVITRKEDQAVYIASGEYQVINRPHHLQYTYAMPQFSPNSDIISITIEPGEMGCTVTFMQSGKDIADELRALSPGSTSASEEGWQQGFDLMAAAWKKAK